MSDSSSVCLTVRKSEQEKVNAIIEKNNTSFDESYDAESHQHTHMIQYDFCDVNYANLEIESTLQESKIPYTKTWDAGDEYPAGREHFRIDANGNGVTKEFYASINENMVALNDVIKALEMNCINEFITEAKEKAAVISWEEQDKILLALETN
jgi:hypothetical protein